MKISYYAIFQYDLEKSSNAYRINIFFPDLSGCFSCADSDEEGKEMAHEILELWLHKSIRKEIPKPSKKVEIQMSKNQKLFKITVNMKTVKGRLFADDVTELTDKNFAVYE